MQLTPEQVNDFLAKAILESNIGECVKTAVDKVLKDLQKSYENPFEQVIRGHVIQLIDKYVRETMAPTLEAQVKQAATKAITAEMVEKIVEAGVSKLNSRY